jgi:hypothetical protein
VQLSEVIKVLQKAQQIIGAGVEDAEVVLHGLEDASGSVIQRIEVAFAGSGDTANQKVTLVHSPTPDETPEPTPLPDAPPETPAEPEPAPDAPAS